MKTFEKKSELLMIYIPIIMVVLSILCLYYGANGKINKDIVFYQAISDYIFFNTLHVPLTFLLTGLIPNFRQWANLKKISGPFNFWWNSIIVYLTCFTILYLGSGIFLKFSSSITLFVVAQALRIFLISFHSSGQSIGVSAMYNQDFLKTNPDSRNRITTIRRIEKILIWSLVVSLTAIWVLNFKKERLVLTFLNPANNPLIAFLGFIIMLSGILIVLMPFIYPSGLRKIKFLFHLRYILHFLQILTPVALIGKSITHGLENVVVIKKLMGQQDNAIIKKFLIYGFIICAFWALIGLPRLLDNSFLKTEIFHIYLSLVWAFDLTHYWADRVLYRMDDLKTRELIGPSLV